MRQVTTMLTTSKIQPIIQQINNDDLLHHSLQTNELLTVVPWIKGPMNKWYLSYWQKTHTYFSVTSTIAFSRNSHSIYTYMTPRVYVAFRCHSLHTITNPCTKSKIIFVCRPSKQHITGHITTHYVSPYCWIMMLVIH